MRNISLKMCLFVFVFIVISSHVQAQSGLTPESDSVYTEVDEMPTFPKGEEAFYKYIAKTIKYPSEARRMGVAGIVIVSFIIEKDGTVTNVMLEQSVSKETDQESMRVISQSPPWNPGQLNGVPVRVRIKRPIKFKLAS